MAENLPGSKYKEYLIQKSIRAFRSVISDRKYSPLSRWSSYSECWRKSLILARGWSSPCRLALEASGRSIPAVSVTRAAKVLAIAHQAAIVVVGTSPPTVVAAHGVRGGGRGARPACARGASPARRFNVSIAIATHRGSLCPTTRGMGAAVRATLQQQPRPSGWAYGMPFAPSGRPNQLTHDILGLAPLAIRPLIPRATTIVATREIVARQKNRG